MDLAIALLISVGNSWKADDYNQLSNETYSLSYSYDGWTYSAEHFKDYHRSKWADTNPEWGSTLIKSHSLISVRKRLFDYQIEGVEFYFDLGLSYTDRISHVTSSEVNFTEALGVSYKGFNLYLTHHSNGGLKGSNAGEDAVYLGYEVQL